MAEFCTLMGNIQSMNIEVKVPEFKDENSQNPLEFLNNVERFCAIKYIREDKKINILNILLQSKARIWYELQIPFQNYENFRIAFLNEFFTIPIQVKLKNKWSLKKFNFENNKNLQTYYYEQAKQATYLRPKLSEFEKNFIIIQQFPQFVRKALASINCEETNVIIQTLANLDTLQIERENNLARKQSFHNINFNNTDIKQMSVNNSTRGDYRNSEGNYSNTPILPDVRFPPPMYNSRQNVQNNIVPSNLSNNMNHLNSNMTH